MATLYVADTGSGSAPGTSVAPVTFATAWAAAVDGDVIYVVGDVTVPNAHNWNKTVEFSGYTVGADDLTAFGDGAAHPARFTRNFTVYLDVDATPPAAVDYLTIVASGKRLTTTNLAYTLPPNTWPDMSAGVGLGETWTDIGVGASHGSVPFFYLQSHTAELVVDGVEAYVGYGLSKAEYDPTVRYPEQNSPNPWYFSTAGENRITDNIGMASTAAFPGWGDVSWYDYNTCMYAPHFIGGLVKYLRVSNCYIHDMGEGIRPVLNTAPDIIIENNWFARIQRDYIQMATGNGNEIVSGTIIVRQNIKQDVIGNGYDGGNPHSDLFQIFYQGTGASLAVPAVYRFIEYSRNMYFVTTQLVRAQPQACFWQMSSGHNTAANNLCYADVAKIRDNLIIGAQKGVLLGASRDAYIRGNTTINPSWFTCSAPVGQIKTLTADVTSYVGNGVFTSLESTKVALIDNLYEGQAGNSSFGFLNNSNLGFKGATIAHTSVFADPSDPGATILTPHAAFVKYRSTGSYVTRGVQYSSARDLLLGTVDWTGEAPWLSFVNTVAAASTLTAATPAYLHGGDVGDLRTLVVPNGVEYRILAADRTTVVTNWTTSNGIGTSQAVGNYVQVRRTSGLAASRINTTISWGGVDFVWALTAQSNNVFPQATFAVAAGHSNFRVSSGQTGVAGLIGETDGNYLILAWKFKPQNVGAGTRRLTAITPFQINLSASTFTVVLRTGANTLCQFTTVASTMAAGADDLFILTVDLTQATFIDGAKLYKNGSQITTFSGTPTWKSGSNGPFPVTTTSYAFFANGSNLEGIEGDLSFFYIDYPTAPIDLSDPEVLARFGVDYFGPNGEGVQLNVDTGVGHKPAVCFLGIASELNSSTSGNRGAGGPHPARTGSATLAQVGAGTWPPPLLVVAENQTVGPYLTGQPVDILVYPIGYSKGGVNFTAVSNLAGTWVDNVQDLVEGTNGLTFTFTPTAPGTHTISFTNDSDYINPDNIVIDVAASPSDATGLQTRVRLGLGIR